jgi:hypothetical protein
MGDRKAADQCLVKNEKQNKSERILSKIFFYLHSKVYSHQCAHRTEPKINRASTGKHSADRLKYRYSDGMEVWERKMIEPRSLPVFSIRRA